MIFDRLDNLSFYTSQHPLFSVVDQFMKEGKYETLTLGSHWLIEPELRVIREPSLGKGPNGGILEAHKNHIDIQIALTHCDRIGYRPAMECTPKTSYDESRDIQFFEETPLSWIDLYPGYFCVLFPQDAHAPLSCDGSVEKLIFKLLCKKE